MRRGHALLEFQQSSSNVDSAHPSAPCMGCIVTSRCRTLHSPSLVPSLARASQLGSLHHPSRHFFLPQAQAAAENLLLTPIRPLPLAFTRLVTTGPASTQGPRVGGVNLRKKGLFSPTGPAQPQRGLKHLCRPQALCCCLGSSLVS